MNIARTLVATAFLLLVLIIGCRKEQSIGLLKNLLLVCYICRN